MSSDTERLIGRLAASAEPVRRLNPPLLRAALWLAAVAAVLAAAILIFADLPLFARRAADPKLALELAGTLATGILAVIAAFELSLPDRSRAWALLPLPSLALWIGASGYSCWRHWLVHG
ncbi:MAG TPA: NrsF family protein, partial [Stellaceae bacterium]|nr:NrsF family protein [Stellaceae bacterium]